MKQIHDSKCPLCDKDATFEFRDAQNIRFFQCGHCGDFFISRSAIARLNKNERQRKSHFALLAASLRGKENILALTLVAGEGLHAEEVPRTSYPV